MKAQIKFYNMYSIAVKVPFVLTKAKCRWEIHARLRSIIIYGISAIYRPRMHAV